LGSRKREKPGRKPGLVGKKKEDRSAASLSQGTKPGKKRAKQAKKVAS